MFIHTPLETIKNIKNKLDRTNRNRKVCPISSVSFHIFMIQKTGSRSVHVLLLHTRPYLLFYKDHR